MIGVTFFDRVSVGLAGNRSIETSISTNLPSQLFKNWEVFGHDINNDIVSTITGNPTSQRTQVRVTSISGYGATYIGGVAQFDAISKTILVKVPKGLFGLKWGQAFWNYKRKPGEQIHILRIEEWNPDRIRKRLGFTY